MTDTLEVMVRTHGPNNSLDAVLVAAEALGYTEISAEIWTYLTFSRAAPKPQTVVGDKVKSGNPAGCNVYGQTNRNSPVIRGGKPLVATWEMKVAEVKGDWLMVLENPVMWVHRDDVIRV